MTSGPHTGTAGTGTTDAGGAVSFAYTGTSVGADTLQVSVDDVTAEAIVDWQPAWGWSGFKSPVENEPTINVVKAGSSVPVRFSLDGDRGLDIFEPGHPSSQPVQCEGGAPVDLVEETATAGSSTLSYHAGSDTYTYIWKTSSSWSGRRRLTLALGDGSVRTASFELR